MTEPLISALAEFSLDMTDDLCERARVAEEQALAVAAQSFGTRQALALAMARALAAVSPDHPATVLALPFVKSGAHLLKQIDAPESALQAACFEIEASLSPPAPVPPA